jgi:hypothetical protein
MAEEKNIPCTREVPLTREEFLAKQKALANMKTMTMRRVIFDALRPSRVVLEGDALRERAVALLLEYDKETRILWTHILLDDQSYLRGPHYPQADEDWPPGYQYMLELPRVQVA